MYAQKLVLVYWEEALVWQNVDFLYSIENCVVVK